MLAAILAGVGCLQFQYNSTRDIFWAGDHILLSDFARVQFRDGDFYPMHPIGLPSGKSYGLLLSCRVLLSRTFCLSNQQLFYMDSNFVGQSLRNFSGYVRFVDHTEFIAEDIGQSGLALWKLNSDGTLTKSAQHSKSRRVDYYIVSDDSYTNLRSGVVFPSGEGPASCFVGDNRAVKFNRSDEQAYLMDLEGRSGIALGINQQMRNCYYNQEERILYSLSWANLYLHEIAPGSAKLLNVVRLNSRTMGRIIYAERVENMLLLFQTSKLQVYLEQHDSALGFAIAGLLLALLAAAGAAFMWWRSRREKNQLEEVIVQSFEDSQSQNWQQAGINL